ncbi:hypothetical protein K488DRAFT_72519, partial [Vararia minispora EC-137]
MSDENDSDLVALFYILVKGKQVASKRALSVVVPKTARVYSIFGCIREGAQPLLPEILWRPRQRIEKDRAIDSVKDLLQRQESLSVFCDDLTDMPYCFETASDVYEKLQKTRTNSRSQLVAGEPGVLIVEIPIAEAAEGEFTTYRNPSFYLTSSHTEPRKRRADQPLDEYSQAKRAKVVSEAPSDVSKSANYEALQKMPSERILDNRPVADKDIPPMPLLYRGFGLFIDIYNGNDNISELQHIDHAGLEVAVRQFATSMAGFFRDEDARRDEGLQHLNSIFAARTTKAPQFTGIRAESFGRYRTDGNDRAPHDAAATVVEFKNKPTGNVSLPEVEATCYVAQLN